MKAQEGSLLECQEREESLGAQRNVDVQAAVS